MKYARALLVALCLLLAVGMALAQVGGPYDLRWNSIDGGSSTFSHGGDYTLAGTVGQPDAGVMSGGSRYVLGGGFWTGGAQPDYTIFLPLLLR